MPGRIDYNRGIVKRKDPTSGIAVIAYNDQPGLYVNERNEPVSDDLAKAAGHDVTTGLREKRRRELQSESDQAIEKKLVEEDEKINAQLMKEEAASAKKAAKQGADGEVHTQKGTSLSAVHRGGGKWWVVDKNGQPVSQGLTRKEADQFISDAAAVAAEEA